MCIPTKLQQKIITRTEEGDTIAAFLVDTMRGETPGVKVCHRMEAAKHLIKYGFTDTDCETTSDRLSRAGGNPVEEQQGGDETPVQSPLSPGERARVRGEEIAAPVTHLDILNYEIAHLIRHETAEGHTLVEFLIHIMTGRDRPFTPRKFRIKPADRMAAARELLRRGFGDLGSRRKPSDTTDEANAYDTLHTGGHVNMCVNVIRRQPSLVSVQRRFRPCRRHLGRRPSSVPAPSASGTCSPPPAASSRSQLSPCPPS